MANETAGPTSLRELSVSCCSCVCCTALGGGGEITRLLRELFVRDSVHIRDCGHGMSPFETVLVLRSLASAATIGSERATGWSTLVHRVCHTALGEITGLLRELFVRHSVHIGVCCTAQGGCQAVDCACSARRKGTAATEFHHLRPC